MSSDPTITILRAMLGPWCDHLHIQRVDEQVGYPGGSYWNRQIVVTGDGKTERYDALMTEAQPLVTATEIMRTWVRQ